MWAACLTTFLWACSAVFAVRSARLLGGTEANFWRLTLALGLLGLWAVTAGHGLCNGAWTWFAWSGLVGIGLGDTAMFQALPRLGSRLTILLIACLTPPMAALMEWHFLGTRLGPAALGFGVWTLLGVGMALVPKKGTETHPQAVPGVLWALTSAFLGAVGAVLNRVAFTRSAALDMVPDGGTAAFLRVLGGYGVVVAAWRLAAAGRTRNPSGGVDSVSEVRRLRRQAIPWVLGNAIFGLVLGVSSYQWALSQLPAGVVLAITSLTPLTIIPLAWWMEGDRPTIRAVAGALVAVSGVVGLVLTW
jgi:drug/metabolite transporter (DMT)-like permease